MNKVTCANTEAEALAGMFVGSLAASVFPQQLADQIDNAARTMQNDAFDLTLRNATSFSDMQRAVYIVDNYTRAGDRLIRANAECREMLKKIGKI